MRLLPCCCHSSIDWLPCRAAVACVRSFSSRVSLFLSSFSCEFLVFLSFCLQRSWMISFVQQILSFLFACAPLGYLLFAQPSFFHAMSYLTEAIAWSSVAVLLRKEKDFSSDFSLLFRIWFGASLFLHSLLVISGLDFIHPLASASAIQIISLLMLPLRLVLFLLSDVFFFARACLNHFLSMCLKKMPRFCLASHFCG